MNDESLIEYPCDFPLKVMGQDDEAFRTRVAAIVARHVGESVPSLRPSRDGRYVSMSFTIRAESRAQLDALYRELSADDQVLFVL